MPKREQLYNLSATALRAFGEVSGELQEKYHYTVEQIKALEREVTYYIKVRDDVRLASGDYVDLKKYDPDMRHLIDTYLSADPSRVLTSFGGATLVELLVDNGISALKGYAFLYTQRAGSSCRDYRKQYWQGNCTREPKATPNTTRRCLHFFVS